MKTSIALSLFCAGTISCVASTEESIDEEFFDTLDTVEQAIDGTIANGFRFTQMGTTQFYGSTPELYFSKFSLNVGGLNSGGSWIKVSGAAPGKGEEDGYPFGGVGAVSWAHPRLDVFYVSASNTLAHSYSNNNGVTWAHDDWGRPTTYLPPNPRMFGSVAVTSSAPGRVDVFVLGAKGNLSAGLPNAALYHRYWDNGYMSSWSSLGSAWVSSSFYVGQGVRGVSWGPGRSDVFAAGAGTLQHWYSTNGTTFSKDAWPVVSGPYLIPGVGSRAPNVLDVVYTASSDFVTTRDTWWSSGSTGDYNRGNACVPQYGNVQLGMGSLSRQSYASYLMSSTYCTDHTNRVRVNRWMNGMQYNFDTTISPAFDTLGKYPYAKLGSSVIVINSDLN